MFVLLGDINLWSLSEDINIKDTDFGAFKYHEKRIDGLYEEGKRSYCQKRGMVSVLQNKKGNKLKDGIKYLEDQLRDHSTVYCQWHDENTVQLMLSTGLLIYIQINILTADIQKIMFDKYLVGKISDHVSDVAMTRNHLIFTHNDSQITAIQFTKTKRLVFDKISKLEPRLSIVELSMPSGRRQEKKICVNRSGDLILVWWKSTMNEVYPWSPAVKDHDRANVHLYRLTGTKFDLACHLRTEFDPLRIEFNARHENVIHSVEQKVSRKGEVTIEWQTYEVSRQDKLQRIEVISVPLPTHTSCAIFSPKQDMLLLCCIDGSVTLHDHNKDTSNSVKAPFIPTLASWHSDGFVFTVGNERGQFQHYDISLNSVKSQMLNDDAAPAIIFDLSTYFRTQPALLRMTWNKKSDPDACGDRCDNGDALFLLLFERGPLGAMRVVEGNNLSGDALICRNLNVSRIDRATTLLLSMNWDTHPRACMHSLNRILNHLFKLKLTPEREGLIQNALGSFHVPIRPISQAVEDEYGDEIRDLTRRFFHHLIRYRLFDKAFRLAIDLNDHDLFMDIHFYALALNDMEMATAAKDKAQNALSRSDSYDSSHSTCSRASCSICSDSISDKETESYSGESESEDSPKRVKSKFIRPAMKNFSRTSAKKLSTPVLADQSCPKNSDLMSTSFGDGSAAKSQNLMSTAFNIPTAGIVEPPTNVSFAPSPNERETNFARLKPYGLDGELISSLAKNSQSYENLSDDFISATFENLRLSGIDKVERSYGKSTGNVSRDSRTERNFFQETTNDDLLSTRFDDIEPDNLIPSDIIGAASSVIIDNIDAGVVSASFGNLSLSAICESSAARIFRNAGSCQKIGMEISQRVTFVDTLGNAKVANSYENSSIGKIDKLALFDSSNNLMSTSFNDRDDSSLESLNSKDDIMKFDNSKFDNPKFDNSKFDNPKFDNPKFDNSKFDNSKFDNSKFDNSKFDNSKFDNSKFDNSKFDNSKFDNPKFDNSKFDNPKFDNSKFDDSKFDNSKFDNPKFDNSKFDNSKFDNSKFDNSKFDNSKFDNSKSATLLGSNDSSIEASSSSSTITGSLANYLNNLPKTTSSLARNSSIPLTSDMNDTTVKFPIPRPNPHSQMLQRQSSVASILQSQHRNNNLQPIRNYRLNYDLDYVPFYESTENLDYQSSVIVDRNDAPSVSSIGGRLRSNHGGGPRGTKAAETKNSKFPISQTNSSKETKIMANISHIPALCTAGTKILTNQGQSSMDSLVSSEKPKVKFSNTVTHILVPGTGQAYRPIQKRSSTQLHPMDPKRELAESLPLCLGNEDYLKDFQPLSRDEEIERARESSRTEEAAKIKVVHFGLL